MALTFEETQRNSKKFKKNNTIKLISSTWADWGRDVGEIAKRNIELINSLVEGECKDKFITYWQGLKKNLNPNVSQEDAIEMLSQHMITKPVFEAIFGDERFTKENPVSKSLEEIVSLLEKKTKQEDIEKLEQFYKLVQKRVEEIDNADGKQKIVVELYDSFFKNAFPTTVKKLGIVYTPLPVVDFIIHSVEWVLNKEFELSISEEKVNIIDPFTGTGTFITRLLQSGIIKKEDLERKYKKEIFANELVLLAYYIASVNIENTYHNLINKKTYESFCGICLRDTFRLYENDEPTLDDRVFSENSERVSEEKKQTITVIMGNPPYSIGQKNANDNAQNQTYKKLQQKIAETYVALSNAKNNKATYDSYIKAFRWATDKLDKTNAGVIAFITNNGWLDTNGLDGFRKQIVKDFDSIYVLNLRGGIRGKSKESAKKEGENVFDIMSGVAITILVKNKTKKEACKVYYYEVDDYKSKQDKLDFLTRTHSIKNIPMNMITPNDYGDWINKRCDVFATWIPIEADKKFNLKSGSFFTIHSLGVNTNRDAWVYGFSKERVSKNMEDTISFYNQQVKELKEARKNNPTLKADEFKSNDSKKISWCSSLIPKLDSLIKCKFEKNTILLANYRPFIKKYLYFGELFIHRKGHFHALFPTTNHKNLVICVTGVGSNNTFTTLISDCIADLGYQAAAQCFPLYWYECAKKEEHSLIECKGNIIKHKAISDFILSRAKEKYGEGVEKEDIFYYVYGILHSKTYREKFRADLKKTLPRIPLINDRQKFWDFSKAGLALSHLHLNYESAPPCSDVKVESLPYSYNDSHYDNLKKKSAETRCQDDAKYNYYAVEKMRFLNKDDKTAIIYNQYHTLKNIPKKAYEYVINGKTPIEWIMEYYAVTTDKKSGIIYDPNDWSCEHKSPRYILDLLLSLIHVSVKTVDIINGLPEVEWDKE